MTANVERARHLALAPDERWWPGVATLVLDLARAQAQGAAQGDLRRITVLVPAIGHAAALRRALMPLLQGAACIGPRVHTLETWVGHGGIQPLGRRTELFQALRASPWVREGFGAQAHALWSLARDAGQLSDELTLAACGDPEAFAGRWRAAAARNFSQRAAAAIEVQTQFVLSLWRAGWSADVGAQRLRQGLERCARAADGPLVWLAPQGAAAWQQSYCEAYEAASGQRAILVVADFAALAQGRPWLVAAWPEICATAGDEAFAPIAQRAAQLARQPALAKPLRIFAANTLEEEAAAAAGWVIEQLRAGAGSVAMVALDRLTARRIRALLDRAAVLVADESGWKLSTTSAAAAVMRWIELVLSDFDQGELEDWLRSPFSLAGLADKQALVDCVIAALVEEGIAGGTQAVRAAVGVRAAAGIGPAAAQLIEQLADLAQRWRRPGTLGRFLGLLQFSLDALGMRAALQADPVGGNVLASLDELHAQLIGSDLPLELGEFRAFLAEHFEEHATADAQVDSPVVMTTLAGMRLRRFDAVLLIGADADHLPARGPAGGLLANCVRQELGLRTESDNVREQTCDLAALLASGAAVAATWRVRRGDEPLALAPLLDRLCLVTQMAGGQPPQQPHPEQWHAIAPAPAPMACPRAPGRLPASVSASAYQDLIDCPYRFFALRILGLRAAPGLRGRPDKRELGLLVHEALFAFHRQLAPGTPWADAHAQLLRIIDVQVAPLLVQQPALIAYRQRLRAMLPGYLQWLAQDQRQGWRWQEGESRQRRMLDLYGQGGIALEGRIDRIDRNDQGALRILDYKVRDASGLRRGQRESGEDVQLLFYAALLEPAPQEAAYLSLQRPADALAPERDVVALVALSTPLEDDVARLRLRLQEDLQRVGAGAGLPAHGAETVCRRCELRSLCRHGFVPGQANGAAP